MLRIRLISTGENKKLHYWSKSNIVCLEMWDEILIR